MKPSNHCQTITHLARLHLLDSPQQTSTRKPGMWNCWPCLLNQLNHQQPLCSWHYHFWPPGHLHGHWSPLPSTKGNSDNNLWQPRPHLADLTLYLHPQQYVKSHLLLHLPPPLPRIFLLFFQTKIDSIYNNLSTATFTRALPTPLP